MVSFTYFEPWTVTEKDSLISSVNAKDQFYNNVMIPVMPYRNVLI